MLWRVSATHVVTISLEYQVGLLFLIWQTTNLNFNQGVAVACAIKAALEQHNLSGKVVLLGTPGSDLLLIDGTISAHLLVAEEGGSGKVALLEKGAYEGMDVCLMCV